MFTPQLEFQGLQSTAAVLLFVAAIGVAGALLVLLMRFERRLVARRVGFLLVTLRLAVLGVLFVVFLEPVVGWTLRRNESGSIVVAVDVSQSMDTLDVQASPAEKLNWAQAMGLIGNENTAARVEDWIAAYRRGVEPEWVAPDETADPQQRAELAVSRRQAVEDVLKSVDELSRAAIARRLLASGDRPVIDQLAELGRVEIVAFAGRAEPVDLATLERWGHAPPDSLERGASDLTQALAAGGTGAGESSLRGIVILTDGRDNAGGRIAESAQRLGRFSVPLFPVLFGSEFQPKDLGIRALSFPATVFQGDKALLEATLNTRGFAGQEIEVTLSRGAELIVRRVKVDGDQQTLQYDLETEQVGRLEYTLTAKPEPGELRADNNSQTFACTVVDDRAHVLLLEGEARWEFRYLDNALDARRTRRPESGAVRATISRRPRSELFSQVARTSETRSGCGRTRDDVAVRRSRPRHYRRRLRGGIAGGHLRDARKVRFRSRGDAGAARGETALSARASLAGARTPAADDGAAAGGCGLVGRGTLSDRRGFRLALSPDGESEPMLQMALEPEANRAVWEGFPGHVWGLIGKAKPGTTVLVEALIPKPGFANAAPTREPLIVRQSYGFGQVLWIGIDSTWRWRHRAGDTYHHRFWGQLARWAAQTKASAGNEFVRFGPDQADVEVGADVVLRAQWTPEFLAKHPQFAAKAIVERRADEGDEFEFVANVDLLPLAGRPLVQEGRVTSLSAGEYRARLASDAVDLGGKPIEAAIYVHAKRTVELADVSPNRPLLTELANASRGQLLMPDELGRLPELLAGGSYEETLRQDVRLWDHWLVLVLLFTLLTAEWATRKWNGLP